MSGPGNQSIPEATNYYTQQSHLPIHTPFPKARNLKAANANSQREEEMTLNQPAKEIKVWKE